MKLLATAILVGIWCGTSTLAQSADVYCPDEKPLNVDREEWHHDYSLFLIRVKLVRTFLGDLGHFSTITCERVYGSARMITSKSCRIIEGSGSLEINRSDTTGESHECLLPALNLC